MDETMMQSYKVYARVDARGVVLELNSDAFLQSTEGWVLVDEGEGDRYHHAQGNYLPKPTRDKNGAGRYRLIDGQFAERTAEEMAADVPEAESGAQPEDARVAALEARLSSYEQAYLEGVNEA